MEKISWWKTDLGNEEKTALLNAFNNRKLTMGEVTVNLEQRFAEKLGVKYALATPSGTAALAMSFLAVGVRPGDEVVVPALTWIATANAAAMIGAHVILVDCRQDMPLMDVQEIERVFTSRTKVVVPVHLNGREVSMKQVCKIASRHGVMVVEDACKAMLAKSEDGNYLGTIGDVGCFSFGMISLISTGYGGMVVTNREDLYNKLREIRWHGLKSTGQEEYVTLGFNFRFSDLLASIGLAQIDKLDVKAAHCRQVHDLYASGLSKLEYCRIVGLNILPRELPLYVELYTKHRSSIIAYLADHEIEALPAHRPIHHAVHLKQNGNFPNADKMAAGIIKLPCGPAQPLENVKRVISVLKGLDCSKFDKVSKGVWQ